MAWAIPYSRKTLVVNDFVIDGNSKSAAPVEIDIEPADGADRARIKSIYLASMATGSAQFAWTPELQDQVAAAFRTSRGVFVDTVRAARNLSAPAALALRAGLIPELPRKTVDGHVVDDPDALIPIKTGAEFDRVALFMLPLALYVALEIAEISERVTIDPRFFEQRSGSGGPDKPGRRSGTAGSARSRSSAGAIAGGRTRKGGSGSGSSQ